MLVDMDNVANLAKSYFEKHECHALALVADDISRAIAGRRWDDVLKLSRVKRRLWRLAALQRHPAPMRGAANPSRPK